MDRIDSDLPLQVTKYHTRLLALAASALGIILMIIGSLLDHPFWETLVSNVGAVVVTTALLSFLWDVGGRRNLTREVLGIVGLQQDISLAGITHVTNNIADVKMQEQIRTSKKIQLFLAYGSTWLSNNEIVIRDFAAIRGNSLTAIFPDPSDPVTLSALAQRFSMDTVTLEQKINESVNRLKKVKDLAKASISVRFYSGQPTHSFYRFDDKFIAVLYNHQRSRTDSPVFVTTGGTFADFIRNDLDFLISNSKEIDLDDGNRQTPGTDSTEVVSSRQR